MGETDCSAQLLPLISAAEAGCISDYEFPSEFVSRDAINYSVAYSKANSLSTSDKIKLFGLFEDNMKSDYEDTWGWNVTEKMVEMFSEKSKYLVLRIGDQIAAFAHFQFCFDDDDDPEYAVLYCFEIQVRKALQGSGIGAYIMTNMIRLARYWKMQKVMLTVLRKSRGTIEFYRKMGFKIDPGSPSCHNEIQFYEIMSVTVSNRREPSLSTSHNKRKRSHKTTLECEAVTEANQRRKRKLRS